MKSIKPGQLLYWNKIPVVVLELKGLSEAIVREIESSNTQILPTYELLGAPMPESITSTEHLFSSNVDFKLATERFELIQPLLLQPKRTLADVKEVAKKSGKGVTTIYRWISNFEETGLISSLIRKPRSDKGSTNLTPEVEEIIKQQIDELYLTKEKPTILKLHKIIKHHCMDADLPIPNRNTIYQRVSQLNARKVNSERFSKKSAKQKYEPLRGNFPGGKFPNAVVQIDHTKMDVIVVDEDHRQPIGRPFFTIAIDVATKMISGFRITLDPPSAMSAGLCVAQAIQHKQNWLALNDIDAEWPIYGKMEMIHMDNAKEFRGEMLKRACNLYGIIMENRPKGQPNYGPHVERAFRTFMGECQDLPGTTFSNVREKLEYDSEGKACLTLKELELWFTIYIIYCYHNQPHKGNDGIPPIQLYNRFIHGNAEIPGIGLPVRVEDEETLRLNFTPYEMRTIQRNGVSIDNIQYFSPILRKWVAAKDPENKSKNRKFIFARDPRDISKIYFLDPDTKKYAPVPYFDATRPAISIWELKYVVNKYKEENIINIDEDTIFKGIKKMREIEQTAIEKTKLAKQSRATEKRKRRMAEQRKSWVEVQNVEPCIDEPPASNVDNIDDEITPFSDIQLR